MGRADPLVARPAGPRDLTPSEPRLRILMAEVQARCAGPFVDAAATLHEERMTRQNARLRRQLGRLRAGPGPERAASSISWPSRLRPRSPEEWADRAAKTWCGEPAVSAARVVWRVRRVPARTRFPRRARTSPGSIPTHPRHPPELRHVRPPSCCRWARRARAGRGRAVVPLGAGGRGPEARAGGGPARLGVVGGSAGRSRPIGATTPGGGRLAPEPGRDRGNAAPTGEARCPGRVRRGGRPRAEQPAGRDRRPRAVAARPGQGRRGRALAPHHPRPGAACPPHPSRPDVRRAAACATESALPASRTARVRASGVRAGVRRAQRPAGLRARRLPDVAPGRIPTPCDISARSCFATRSRPRPPAAGSWSVRPGRTAS